jgi:nitrogen fixation protein NifU and related proteins
VEKNRGTGGGHEHEPGPGSAHRDGPAPGRGGSGAAGSGTPPLNDLYREVLLDHYKRPRGRRKLERPDVRMDGFNPTCGDQVQIALALKDDRIEAAQVECQGCSISVASGSMMAELLVGKTREEVGHLVETFKGMMHGREPEPEMDLGDLEALEGVRQFPVRIKCALLAWTTMLEALAAFDRQSTEGAGPASGSGETEEKGSC